jgi:hypothetical protein
MTDARPNKLSLEELDAEGGMLLPSKEVLSLLDLNVDIDIALDFVAPIDLAVAANLNVAAPINAAVSANVLSFGSYAAAQADQGLMLDQYISGEAIAHAPQTAVIDQSGNDTIGGSATPEVTSGDPAGTVGDPSAPVAPVSEVVGTTVVPESTVSNGSLLDGGGGLLNVDVKVAVDANLAAPIAGAVAVNANVAAPIDAAAAANVGSVGSEAIAVSNQQAYITQNLDDVTAEAIATQDAEITQ